MMQPSHNTNPNQIVFVMQIITVSMVMGIVVFLGILLIITQGQQPKQPNITYMALGAGIAAIIGHIAFRLPIDSRRLEEFQNDGGFDPHSEEVFTELAPRYQAEHIIKNALLEGAAFFNGVAYLVETIWWSLAMMGLLILLILIRFPTQTRIRNWIERKTLALQFGNPKN